MSFLLLFIMYLLKIQMTVHTTRAIGGRGKYDENVLYVYVKVNNRIRGLTYSSRVYTYTIYYNELDGP